MGSWQYQVLWFRSQFCSTSLEWAGRIEEGEMTTTEDGLRVIRDGQLRIDRAFTAPGVDPFDEVEWEVRGALIGFGGKVAFEQKDVEFPKAWSQNATNIVAQ